MSNAEHDYKQSFGLGNPPDKEKTRAALNLALDTRKFEIGLYWQRFAYSWALIAAAFAGYFAILSAEKLPDKEYFAFIVSCIGLTFTWAWFLINRGSKFWQENWENHVDSLENEIVGPLYKTILHRPANRPFIERHIMGPQAISVSRVNLTVSIFMLCIWIALLIHALPTFHRSQAISWKHVGVGIVTLFFLALMRFGTETHLGSHEHAVTKRKAKVIGPSG